jgi:hypothetical protein
LKQPSQSVSTDAGIQIDASAQQPENADFPIDESRELDSNTTMERDRQPLKQDSPTVLTDAKIKVDERG